jgi:hypothetical protein
LGAGSHHRAGLVLHLASNILLLACISCSLSIDVNHVLEAQLPRTLNEVTPSRGCGICARSSLAPPLPELGCLHLCENLCAVAGLTRRVTGLPHWCPSQYRPWTLTDCENGHGCANGSVRRTAALRLLPWTCVSPAAQLAWLPQRPTIGILSVHFWLQRTKPVRH